MEQGLCPLHAEDCPGLPPAWGLQLSTEFGWGCCQRNGEEGLRGSGATSGRLHRSFPRLSLLPANLPGQTFSPAVKEKGMEGGQEAITALGSPLLTQSTCLTQLKKLGSEKRGLGQSQPTRI